MGPLAAAHQRDTELAWRGRTGGVLRPMTYGTMVDAVRGGGALFILDGLPGIPAALGLIDVRGASEVGLGVLGVIAILSGAGFLAMASTFTIPQLERWAPVNVAVTVPAVIALLLALVLAAGANLGVVAVYYLQLPLLAFVLYRTRWAVAVTATVLAAYAVALASVDDVSAPVLHWLIVLAAAASTAVIVGGMARRTDEARAELADLNAHLETRVAQQVDELERVGRLRRFLSPQVADVVVTRGSEDLLEPHRREVAVLFCDLRGFTRFTNAVDPDTVVAVLAEYYAAVGPVLEAHGATIGGYDGDGVMAYLGDPIPRPDAAAEGVAMARAIAERLDRLAATWHDVGHDLGFGIGLAFGPATLGVVGFDGRFDYTPLGAVVNLASRLCADATTGEVVIDGAVRRAIGRKGTRTRGPVELKGFGDPVATYALVR